MPVDLHTHSTASDGTDSPSQLVRVAARAGLSAIALTDHDILSGIDEASAAGIEHGVEVIPGVELSLDWDKGGMHLIVLWLEPRAGPLQDRLEGLRAGRDDRNASIVARLGDLGMPVDLQEIEAEAGGGSVGRPHIASVLMKHGYVPDFDTAFEELLGAHGTAYVGRPRLGMEEALSLAVGSGGVPILAHPHTLGIDNRFEMADLMDRMREAGLLGIECLYGSYHRPGRDGMVAMARRFGLIPSGGSDYHGTYKPDVAIGLGRVGLGVPDEILTELESVRGLR